MRFLHVIEGPDSKAAFALPDLEPQLIGRSTEALPITDPSVSRRHAEMTPDGTNWFVRDLDSTNGTLVNNVVIGERTALHPGDRIQCGSSLFLFDQTPQDGIPIQTLEAPSSGFKITRRHARTRPAEDPPGAARNQLDFVIAGTELAMSESDQRTYLEAYLGLILTATGGESAVVIVSGTNGSKADLMIARHARQNSLAPIHLDQKLVESVRLEPTSVLAESPNKDQKAAQSCLAAPLRSREQIRGAVVVMMPIGSRHTEQVDLELLHVLAGQAGMALEQRLLVDQVLVNNRLAAMGETVAAISHGIKNILQGLRGGTDAVALALQKDDLEMAGRGWNVLARNLDRIQSLTMNMLGFVRNRAFEIERVNLEELMTEVTELLVSQSKRAEVRLETILPPNLPPVPLDASAMLQAMLNLLSNAIDATPRGGIVTLRAKYDIQNDTFLIDIEDSGHGIDPQVRERLFEPFVTSKGQRGTGLGLVVSQRILEQHQGRLECIESGASGTVMRMTIPGNPSEHDPADTDAPKPLDGELNIEFGEPEH
jgi:two-component system NtrC family sensor kinase